MSSKESLSFSIVLQDNFIKRTKIPPAIRPHHEEKITKEWLLKTPPSNKIWAVEVKQQYGRTQDYHLCGRSWKMFAESQNLMQGDTLYFRHLSATGDLDRLSVFDVDIHDHETRVPKRGCPPPYPSVISLDITRSDAYPGKGRRNIDDGDDDEDDSVEVELRPEQSTRLKKRSRVERHKIKRSKAASGSKIRRKAESVTSEEDEVEKETSEEVEEQYPTRIFKKRFVAEDAARSHMDAQKFNRSKASGRIRRHKAELVTSEEEEETEEERSEEEEENDIYYGLTFTSSHVRCMYFPLGLGRKAGLKRKKSITLVNVGTDEKWEIALTKAANGRVSMGTGWSRFRKDNKIKIGDEYMFGFFQDEDEGVQLLFKKKA